MPSDAVLGVRVSHTDWVEGGWTTEETVELSRRFKAIGVDFMDVSSGGNDPRQQIPLGPGYQVPGAAAVKKGAGIITAAVGLITEAKQAQAILDEGHADWIYLARVLLRDPYWPMRAAVALGIDSLRAPWLALRAACAAAALQGHDTVEPDDAALAAGNRNAPAPVLLVAAADEQDMIAIDAAAGATGEHGAIGIAIEGDGKIGIVGDDGVLNMFRMEGAAVEIDVAAVGRAVELDDISAEAAEEGRGEGAG
jgi:hypothetical protein